ncbi:MAG TPA: L,D-transpeptidase family protein [Acidimicrobiia bacterium]|nr:L,D-transpeptidase family protein [Acidimicrobiia bacterium]
MFVATLALVVAAGAGCDTATRAHHAPAQISPIVARDSTWTPPSPPATTLPRLEDLQPEAAAAANAYQVPTTTPSEAATTPEAPPPVPIARSKNAELPIYAGATDVAPARTLRNPTEFGSPLTLLVVGTAGESLQVGLPLRPNGSVGWVHASDVDVVTIDDRIDIDLPARKLTWTRAGAPLMEHAVAVGAASSPTPTGQYFVTDVVDTDPSGPYGPRAVALSAYSDTFRSSNGDYRIAIHGTNRPSSIGQAVSEGCARLPNDLVTTLAAGVPLGTPVTIH